MGFDPSRASTTLGTPRLSSAQDENDAALEITDMLIKLTRIRVLAEALVDELEGQPFDMPHALSMLRRELSS